MEKGPCPLAVSGECSKDGKRGIGHVKPLNVGGGLETQTGVMRVMKKVMKTVGRAQESQEYRDYHIITRSTWPPILRRKQICHMCYLGQFTSMFRLIRFTELFMGSYVQFAFNLSLLLMFLYLVVQFILTIQRDVQYRVSEYSMGRFYPQFGQ